ncbi:hypothetical protein ACFQJ7_16260 [Halovenus rubra]|uniref:Uncharacterized protein n=2 Tax=Halovenus rubra TaxID=869890 RepID=A0ACC7E684_9EURY|nr:hypothetical protein [Halovenus rubra]
MDRLYPQHVPMYESDEQRERLWGRCSKRGEPVIAIRNARRGFIVRYDLQHLDNELTDPALRQLRDHTAEFQPYPTGDMDQFPSGTDPLSQAESVGGEAGAVSGDLHTPSETAARNLASQLSAVVFDRSNWR